MSKGTQIGININAEKSVLRLKKNILVHLEIIQQKLHVRILLKLAKI
jgi:hypothetical protein